MGHQSARKNVRLECRACGSRNYTVSKKRATEKMILRKFCPACNQHTEHHEGK
ncbi:50S ribosomal protein L33 [Myxococcota bacterium]|nr:50S ribosomal protein L33 [Myxococcota bacterium]MBU1430985.1 50S ribosomal protein L33 [Myxococcota bacterium]MBU1897220.1 50S ribosomal protein L33 [Myxococcota bacterium]